MPTINQLSSIGEVTSADQIPTYDESNGDARKMSVLQLQDYIETNLDIDDVGFLQAGTGAVERSVQSKLRDVVSVKDFGAVGDGVTDDTAAFVAARGNTKPEQTNVQVAKASQRDLPTYEYEYNRAIADAALLLFRAGSYGFSESWSEQFRGFLVKMKRSATSADSHWLFRAIYPVDFSVTIDGINGFKFGDTLKTNMIPRLYNTEYDMVFTVTKIAHVIENKDWQTTLTTRARLTSFAEDAPTSGGSIHEVPGAFVQQPGLTTPRTQPVGEQ